MTNTPKKIFLAEKDGFREVKRRISRIQAVRVVLVIPKSSVFGDSVTRFHELHDLAREQGKEIIIESVDDHILELASIAQLRATNPLFRSQERVVVDIIPRSSRSFQSDDSLVDTRSPARKSEEDEVRRKEEEPSRATQSHFFDSWKIRSSTFSSQSGDRKKIKKRESTSQSPRARRSFSKRSLLIVAFSLIGMLFAGGVALWWLPRASVVLTFQRAAVSVDLSVEVSTSTVVVTQQGDVILVPGELFRVTQNIEHAFPAQATRTIDRKATGKLRVFNAFSSSDQILIATTRFRSPEGKTFRLDRRTVVPGARIEDGNIIPSSIIVSVIADEAGEGFNLSSSEGWTIPGFEGTPKFSGFYATLEEPTQGGFMGSEADPTDQEIQGARDEMARLLNESTRRELSFLSQEDLVVLDDAERFSLGQVSVISDPDDSRQFRVFAEGERLQLVFRESDVMGIAIIQASSSLPAEFSVETATLVYEDVSARLQSGAMTFRAKGEIRFVPRFDREAFQNRILGKDEAELRGIVFGLLGVERANITLWPFWVDRVPQNTYRVKVEVE